MLAPYIDAAMRHARCETLPDDGTCYCEIPIRPGVWANEATLEATLIELHSVLEGWIAIGLSRGDTLPEIDGIGPSDAAHA